jgi:hypothetical protein
METFEGFSKKYEKITNIKIKQKSASHEVDPYGEEDWNDISIDWNNIKIVHPENNKNCLGKNVLIVPNSDFYGTNFSGISWYYNPKNTIGEIIKIVDSKNEFFFWVKWNNGEENSYRKKDLTLINIEYV